MPPSMQVIDLAIQTKSCKGQTKTQAKQQGMTHCRVKVQHVSVKQRLSVVQSRSIRGMQDGLLRSGQPCTVAGDLRRAADSFKRVDHEQSGPAPSNGQRQHQQKELCS